MNSRSSSPARRAFTSAVRACAVFEKTGGELLSSPRTAYARPGGPRLRLCRTGGACVPSPSGRNPLALCRRNAPVALGPAPRSRLPPRPLTQSQSKREEALKREAWSH